MLIDNYLPVFHFNEKHVIKIASDAETISSVMEQYDLGQSRLIRLLFWLRGMPSTNISMRSLTKGGFIELERLQHEEIVIGLIGQFWKSNGNLQRFDPKEFISFNRGKFLKAVWNFHIENAQHGSSTLSTETRVFCTDEFSRKRFRYYWMIVKPFSGLIRKEILRNIKKLAEKNYALATGAV